MSRVKVRLATAADIRAFAKRDVPEWCVEWVAYVAERDGAPIALGSVYWDKWGQVWGAFDCRERISAFTMHRLARRTIEHLREMGVGTLHAFCDEQVLRSDVWLKRLGFRRSFDSVWTCTLK